MSPLDRAFVRAWVGPFVVLAAGFVVLLLLGHVRKLAAAALGGALRIEDALRLAGALIPHLLVFALPVAHLVAVVLVRGRMADDGELTAWAAAGVSPMRQAVGPLLGGAAVMAIALPVAHIAQPAGWRALHDALVALSARNLRAALLTTPAKTLGRTTFSARPQDGELTDVVLIEADRGIAVAARGRIDAAHQRLTLTLVDGEVHPADRDPQTYIRTRFDHLRGDLDFGEAIARRSRLADTPGRWSTPRLRTEARRHAGTPRGRRLAKMAGRRTALPALALVFGIAGAAIVALVPRRRWTATLATGLAYYILMRAADAMAASTAASVPWAVWGPHALLLGAATLALGRAGRPR